MMSIDRDALLCDLAEEYGIYDMRALPVKTLTTLSLGLRPDSRIMLKMAGMQYIAPEILLASLCDNITLLRYNLFADEHDKPPQLYTDIILGKGKNDNNETIGFRTPEELLAEMERIDELVRRRADG